MQLALKIDVSDTNVTKQGNTFNGASELVKLNESGQLPALDACHLTNITSTSLYVNCESPLKNTSGLISVEFDDSLKISDNKLSVVSDKIIKSDGSVSFTAEQSGITPIASTGLTTKSYVDTAVNKMIKSDGSVTFTAEQKGVDPVSSTGLTTLQKVQALISAINFSGLATTTLGNITSAGKSTITNLSMPDYSNRISKALNTTFTADTDGWINAYSTIANVWNDLQIYINGLIVAQTTYSYGNDSPHYDGGIFPVCKGQTYNFTSPTNATGLVAYFIPVKGAH